MTYGDNDLFTHAEWLQWVRTNDKYGFPIDWQRGDCVMFCNYRMSHGRPGYQINSGEKRNLGVVLGPVFDRVGQRNDKF